MTVDKVLILLKKNIKIRKSTGVNILFFFFIGLDRKICYNLCIRIKKSESFL